VNCCAIVAVLLQVRQQLVDFPVAEVLEEVKALGREHLGGAHAPAVVSGDGERLVMDPNLLSRHNCKYLVTNTHAAGH
jgi:hypothetical protein